ncbi:MAG: hypothetical protein NZ556_01595 [Fimbriimonadales bacterium]|nr:hypothetical protein [Fimbriimonadales bacterium]
MADDAKRRGLSVSLKHGTGGDADAADGRTDRIVRATRGLGTGEDADAADGRTDRTVRATRGLGTGGDARATEEGTDRTVRATRGLGTGEDAHATRQRGWIWGWFLLGLTARTIGAGALFWALLPLWLCLFWTAQGFPPTLSDLPRWYGIGAFNAAPIIAMAIVSPLAMGASLVVNRRRDNRAAPHHRLSLSATRVALSALLYALFAPPLAYALLLMYAGMWQYRAWDVMTPTLLRAYLMLAPACGAVGAIVGWSLKR